MKCKLRQRVLPETKHWYCRLFVQDLSTKEKVYINIFHQQLVQLFQANKKELDAATNEEAIEDFFLESEPLQITYNITNGKVTDVSS